MTRTQMTVTETNSIITKTVYALANKVAKEGKTYITVIQEMKEIVAYCRREELLDPDHASAVLAGVEQFRATYED